MNATAPRRLEPCPCGSGRRYKDCHGSLRAAALPEGYAAGLRLRNEDRLEEALAVLDEKIAAAPRGVAMLNLRALVRQDLHDVAGALSDFEAAIAIDPFFVDAHFNRGQALLMQGDYARGWPEYEWRTRVPGYADYANYSFGMPRWKGEDLAGRSILVHAEQGQGDTIQFARFIAPFARAGASIDVFCHPPLAGVMSRVPGVRAAMSQLAERPTHDFHAPIIDLGIARLPDASALHWFGPYIEALPPRIERFAPLFAASRRPLVGIAWKGSPRNAIDRTRSLTREVAAELATGDATYVNLQLGEPALSPAMIDAAGQVSDWDDTAAIVAQLDAVIAVDTALAHFAGAMGKPVSLLLRYAGDWRYGQHGESTPWYPSMTLLRQSRRGDWSDVIAATRRPGASPR